MTDPIIRPLDSYAIDNTDNKLFTIFDEQKNALDQVVGLKVQVHICRYVEVGDFEAVPPPNGSRWSGLEKSPLLVPGAWVMKGTVCTQILAIFATWTGPVAVLARDKNDLVSVGTLFNTWKLARFVAAPSKGVVEGVVAVPAVTKNASAAAARHFDALEARFEERVAALEARLEVLERWAEGEPEEGEPEPELRSTLGEDHQRPPRGNGR